jgi:hypothetical protein
MILYQWLLSKSKRGAGHLGIAAGRPLNTNTAPLAAQSVGSGFPNSAAATAADMLAGIYRQFPVMGATVPQFCGVGDGS